MLQAYFWGRRRVVMGESRAVKFEGGGCPWAARADPLGRVPGKAGSIIPSLRESYSGNANRITSGRGGCGRGYRGSVTQASTHEGKSDNKLFILDVTTLMQ